MSTEARRLRAPLRCCRFLIVLGLLPLCVFPETAQAQNQCDIPYSALYREIGRGSPTHTIFLTRVTAICDDGMRIYADSAVVTPPRSVSQFFGNVRFSEEGRELTSNQATYRSDLDRLDAAGDVFLSDSTGSTLEGDNLLYLRDGATGDVTQLTMTSLGGRRPVAHIRPGRRDAQASDSLPDAAPDTTAYVVTARRIVIEGEGAFRGEGNVEVDRGALHATGDNMVYDQGLGDLTIAGNGEVEGDGYAMTGQSIRVILPGDQVEAVVAEQDATLVSDDLDLTAPRIHVFVLEEALQRLVASGLGTPGSASPAQGVGPSRPTAVTQDFLLLADSIDVRSPGEVLERVVAVGRAHGESFGRQDVEPDTTLPADLRNDWLEGDTIVATFVERPQEDGEGVSPVGDTAAADVVPDSLAGFQAPAAGVTEPQEDGLRSRYALDRLEALGNARSLYRMAPTDSTLATPAPGARPSLALHYALGERIEISMKDGEVDAMEIVGQTRGFHFEPVRVATAPVDTATTTPPDSVGSQVPDTVGGRLDSEGAPGPDGDGDHGGSTGSEPSRQPAHPVIDGGRILDG